MSMNSVGSFLCAVLFLLLARMVYLCAIKTRSISAGAAGSLCSFCLLGAAMMVIYGVQSL